MQQLNDVISTREQLRAVYDEPSNLVTRKVISHLDKHCGLFISRSPFVLMASADASGNIDVSPKGDPIGFVKILDSTTLAIPDRPGNERADSMENILQNPKVGLIFMIPGKSETLRVSGEAYIVRDEKLRSSMEMKSKVPELVIVIDVKEVFFHCSKCMIRSKLWKPDTWPNLDGLPRLAETMVDAGKLELSENEMHKIVENDENTRLY